MTTVENRKTQTLLRRLLLLTAALTIAAAGWYLLGDSDAVSAAEASASTEKVLATVNGQPITEAQVLASVAGRLLSLERQRHDLIASAVETEILNRLIELEAKKRGISQEELIKAEVEDKASQLPAERINAFYEAQRRQLGGRIQPLEKVEAQIRQYLAYEDFSNRLRAAADVDLRLEPFRVEVAANGPQKGPDGAPVTIVEFSDFECPYCQRVVPALEKVSEAYGDKVRIVFRQFPLTAIHPNAQRAGEASLCAHEQGKFWQLHDAMFADQSKLAGDGLQALAAGIEGLDLEAFASCLESGTYAAQVERDLAEGRAAGVTGTPAFFINGRFLNGAQTFEKLSEIIDDELGG
ncbi:MAG: DsbA family protein [Acidobacteria bacterium]|nr:MAG: DsbA family protein [Acidobacteriota bacterium]